MTAMPRTSSDGRKRRSRRSDPFPGPVEELLICAAPRMTHSYCALHHDLLPHHHGDEFRRVTSAPGGLQLIEEDEVGSVEILREIGETEEEGNRRRSSPTRAWGEVRSVVELSRLARESARRRRRRLLTLSLVAVVFFGCAAVVPTELAVDRDRGAMRLVTIFNYVLVAIESWIDKGYEGLVADRKIPMGNHVLTLALGLVYNIAQNGAIAIGFPMALVLILKNSQLLFQMAANSFFVGERYLLVHELAAAVLVSGVLVVVVATTTTSGVFETVAGTYEHTARPEDPALAERRRVMLGGVALMLVANVARAASNVATQRAFARCGNFFVEKLFYEHALGLPFLIGYRPRDLVAQARRWSLQREPLVVARVPIQIPALWILVALQAYATFECTRASARVVGLSSAVTLALALAVQRFLSIVFSAAVLNAPPYPPLSMWLGALLVVAGAVSYVLAPKPIRRTITSSSKDPASFCCI
ncbi:hypothetical protein CTAYLR_008330 [Chrysophaeum taylorii]|uniref:Uncharacterized protein n=1 Tax=Chrysophaeum taylorii TaxID=2483200 RepID=A0AAD7UCM5_9STRA|nr:hypothetical protein CTAYLR_008330 [Chrysophaeum taylorii]